MVNIERKAPFQKLFGSKRPNAELDPWALAMVHFLLTSCPFRETSQQQWSDDRSSQPSGKKTMKRRLVVALAGLAISFALPTYAQQKDLADPQTTQKILASFKGIEEAQNNKDAAARAAFYTRDAVFVTPGGPIIGRQAIEKWLADLYQWWHPKNFRIEVDGNAYHLIGTAGNEAWATGEWSETGQGKHGEPFRIKGYWLCIYVREADDWKIRVDGLEHCPGQCHTRRQEFCTTTGRNAIPDRQP